MNKEKVVFLLNSIIRHITYMDSEIFESYINDSGFEIQFERFSFTESSKVNISMLQTMAGHISLAAEPKL
jgi:hypothetical protein